MNPNYLRKKAEIESEKIQRLTSLKGERLYNHLDIAGLKLERWIFLVGGLVFGAVGLFIILLATNHLK